MLETLTMWPSGRSRNTGRNAWLIDSVPHQFTLKTRSIAFWSRSLNLTKGWMMPGAVDEAVDGAEPLDHGVWQNGDRGAIRDIDDVGRDSVGVGREARRLGEGRRIDVDRGHSRATPERFEGDLATHAAPGAGDDDDLAVELHAGTITRCRSAGSPQPNVKQYASAPASRNSISTVRSSIAPGWRIS